MVVAVLLGLLGLVGTAAPASAHAVLESTTPQQGGQVSTPPTTVSLTFSEGVGMNDDSVTVLSSSRHRVDLGRAHHLAGQPSTVAVDLVANLPQGSYVVIWRVVSSDSHPIAGTFSFGVGVPAGTPPATSGWTVVDVLAGLLRGLGYVGSVLLLGGTAFVTALWARGRTLPRPRRLVTAGWLASVVAAALLFLLQGPYAAGTGLTTVLDPRFAADTVQTRFGVLLLVRLTALVFAVPVLRMLVSASEEEVRRIRWFLVGLGALFLLTFSLSEHAGQGDLVLVWALLDAAHLAAASVWVGGLAVLVYAMLGRSTAVELGAVLPRWSRVAMVAVATLVLTGATQAWREIGSIPALVSTTYGYLVMAKVAGLCGLLVLADLGRRWVNRSTLGPSAPEVPAATPAPPPGAPRAAGTSATTTVVGTQAPARRVEPSVAQLRRSVIAEVVIAAVVLGLSAVLVNTEPAKVDYDPPYAATVVGRGNNGENITVRFDVARTKPGPTTMSIHTSAGGRPVPFVEVRGSLVERTQGLGPVEVIFTPSGVGEGKVATVVVPQAGSWTLTAQIRTDETTDYSATTVYPVR